MENVYFSLLLSQEGEEWRLLVVNPSYVTSLRELPFFKDTYWILTEDVSEFHIDQQMQITFFPSQSHMHARQQPSGFKTGCCILLRKGQSDLGKLCGSPLAVMVSTRMLSNQAFTKKISAKVGFEKSFDCVPGQLKYCLLCCEETPLTTDILKMTTLRSLHSFLRCCTTWAICFYHIGQSNCTSLCVESLRFRLWADCSLFWHPQWWNACTEDQISQRKRRIYWHPYPHSRACLSSPHLHHCAAQERGSLMFFHSHCKDKAQGTPSFMCAMS